MFEHKILQYNCLNRIKIDNPEKKVVLCHGTYDILHPGHLIHLEEAKNLGDILVVTITADDYVLKKKKTFFKQELRIKQVASIEIVDFVALIFEPSALTAIENLKPDYYVKGSEFKDLTTDPTSNIIKEKELVEKYGGRIYFTDGQTFSSTKIGYFLGTSSEAEQEKPFVKRKIPLFKDLSDEKYELNVINKYLRALRDLNICVIGETIIDEARYIKLRSISSKSKCISGEELNMTSQFGGAGIIAKHLSNFVKHVDLYTNELNYNIEVENLTIRPLCKAELIKTRFIDHESNNVIYENKLIGKMDSSIATINNISDYDLVIVADFGHGLIDLEQANRLSKMKSKFFAVMAQSNSSNFGFNIIDKYPFADYFSLNKLEAELLLKRYYLDENFLFTNLSKVLKSKFLALTLSNNGAMMSDYSDIYKIPSLSLSITDTVGCGDAFLAFSSTALASGFDSRYSLLFGSIGSAIMTQKVMNESAVSYQEFLTVSKIII